jgi:protocatechuate 3,4-dioxygenase beta subunit
VAGTVVDGAGRSLAGVEVELTGGGADRGRLRDGAGIPPEAGWYVTRRTTTTDADGRFALGDLSAGDYTVAALLADRPPSRRIALNLDPGGRNVGLVLVMAKGEPLRGQVVDGEGAGIEGVYVGARLMRSRAREASPSPRSPLHARTGPDGVFAFEDMVPGRYDLTFQPFEAPRDRGPWLDTEVLGAETGQNDLRVELPPGAWIRGRVLDAAGGPRIGDIVMALAQDSTRSPNATVDAEGAFALVVEPGLLWNLEVHGPWPGPSFETVFLTEYAVAPGTRDLELRLPAEDPSSGR